MATLQFRGVMLFVIENHKIREVLFPNTRRKPPGKYRRKHHDNTKAYRHYAGLLHVDTGKPAKRHDLTSAKVSIKGGSELLPASAIGDIADITSVTGVASFRLSQNASRGCRIHLALPPRSSISTTPPDKAQFTLDQKTCHLYTEIKVPGAIDILATMQDGAKWSPLHVGEKERAIFYHYDDEYPTDTQLQEEEDAVTLNAKTDNDFKWLYALCTPQPGSKEWSGRKLPAPERDDSKKVKTATVSVSTCFPGRISI